MVCDGRSVFLVESYAAPAHQSIAMKEDCYTLSSLGSPYLVFSGEDGNDRAMLAVRLKDESLPTSETA